MPIINPPSSRVAIQALAVVGFVALIGASMWLAVYSTRFVPSVVNRIGGAAVYLGEIFNRSPKPNLYVVPSQTASTTIQFGESNPVSESQTETIPKQIQPTAGAKTNSVYQIGSTTVATSPVQNGLPDLIVSIDAIGYLTSTSTDSFVASSTVPAGNRPAVRFTIKNVGTSSTGAWRWSASIPTQTAYIYQSQPQQSLNPGDSIDYTLGFDQATSGADKTISITANFDHTVAESNTNNNSASAKITILGS